MYARSQMPSVSRTLWSVISTPMPRSRSAADQPLHLADRDRVDARERLVEEDVARRGEQAARHLGAPPLAAGELLAQRVRHLLQPELGEERVRRSSRSRRAHPERLEDAGKFSRTVSWRKIEASCGR